MSFETQLKRLSHRDWNAVQGAWIPAVAGLNIEYPGKPPAEAVEDVYLLAQAFASVPAHSEIRTPVSGVAVAMLHESIFLLHKAANVLVGAQTQALGGFPTWSVATAYQSAFFSMEALLQLLGVGIVEISDRTMLVDLWPSVEQRLSRKNRESYILGSEVHLLHINRVDHYHRWAVFKRVLRTLSNAPIEAGLINALQEIDDKEFARQRNRLQYKTSWTFGDLHTSTSSLTYCRFRTPPPLLDRLDVDNEDFSLVLATLLFSSSVGLLSALATHAPAIASEKELLASACAPDRLVLRTDFEYAQGGSIF
ncbi:MAG: hypothetical protein JWQ07_327 [Ramlibacter sp.]|nr:hypothetical protein [Ramlibacter sp.]